ncbi:hypothetical protein IE81DRAFT_365039 [Ceraceosorus guamensis]|uniref:Rho-GAP domain-containing protein n=1 Tax=Ceraceosorus guamensis TaxID=1522189 RepID=A0A316W3C0_9BASI|nr:hypothetical protein IE81DRAFT_365039 [Ceraceosorus guamensis]PWN44290.1 hypothetical protein IE81DRAFT_365039 [Ceraceosorus guamensis]
MTAPSTLTINLPPTFVSSYWSAPYRLGVNSLYTALQRGIDEDSTILALAEHRASLEYNTAEALSAPFPSPNLPSSLFRGAREEVKPHTALSHAIRALELEATTAQAQAHGAVAHALERNILTPFGKWSDEHVKRVRSSWEHVNATVERFEALQAEVDRLRRSYESKCRQADEAEDDARFAGGSVLSPPPSATGHVNLSSQQSTAASNASPEKDIKTSSEPEPIGLGGEKDVPDAASADPERLKRRETLRDQFGFRRNPRKNEDGKDDRYTTLPLSPRSASATLPPSSPTFEIGNRSVSGGSGTLTRSGTITSSLSAAISRATEAPAFATIRGALGGLNDPRHVRLRRDAEAAEDPYRTAVRDLDRTRLGLEETLMEHFGYAERWENERARAVRTVLLAFNGAFDSLLPQMDVSLKRLRTLENKIIPAQAIGSLIYNTRTGPFLPQPEVFHGYYNGEANSLAGSGIATFGMDLVAFSRAEALAHEDSEVEGDAGGALRAGGGKKGALPALPLAFSALLAALDRAYDDPGRWPAPSANEGEAKAGTRETALHAHEERRKAWLYDVPLAQSHACREAIITHITQSRNPGAEAGAGLDNLLAKFDAPTLAATVKIWALELADSLVSREVWDPINSIYGAASAQESEAAAAKASSTSANAATDAETTTKEGGQGREASDHTTTPTLDKGKGRVGLDPALEERIRKGILEDLGVVLNRLPKLHLVCLDALVGHLSRMIKKTPTNESNGIYLNKLGLALGRVVLRPPRENAATIPSRAPTLLAMDLIGHYDELLPALLDRKTQEGESALAKQRKMPVRKRTKPIDVRPTRTSRGQGIMGPREPAPPVPALPAKDLKTGTGVSELHQTASPETSHSSIGTGGLASAVRPSIQTSDVAKSGPNSASAEAPTPLSERVLGVVGAGVTPATSTESLAPSTITPRPGSAATSSDGGSAYGTPTSEGPTQPVHVKSATTTTVEPSAAAAAGAAASSNVARLSRQFGSLGSGSNSTGANKVRGARPMGSRPPVAGSAATPATSTTAGKRESRDLGPDGEGSANRPLSERRRSWSRTMELTDSDLVSGDDDI